jgi:hypothetical protein
MRQAIGDVHGRKYWKKYLDRDFTEFYILGDYFDSFNIPFARQYRNFKELCEVARKDPRVKLCLGNHDYHYLSHVFNQQYSGFQEKNFLRINEALEQNIDLLQILYVTPDKYLVSHAGLSNTFLEKMKALGVESVDGINDAFVRDRNILAFDGFDIYGDDTSQSPIWIRPFSLSSDPAPGYSQIVGHTPMREIGAIAAAGINLVFIDTGDNESIYEF